jgi:DNA-directed RNA polymerase subunit RPC12/RpoP
VQPRKRKGNLTIRSSRLAFGKRLNSNVRHPMQTEAVIAAVLIIALVVVGLFVVTRKRSSRPDPTTGTSTRSRGPTSLHYVCAGCSAQFTHSRRTIGAWEKGTRRFFCSNCHTKWRDKQPPREVQASAVRNQGQEHTVLRPTRSSGPLPAPQTSRPSLAPARSGCLTVVVVLVAIPVVITLVAAYASQETPSK